MGVILKRTLQCSPVCATLSQKVLKQKLTKEDEMKTATARARINPEVKEKAERILHDLGLSVSGAFELFYRQVIINKGLPFDVKLPNDVTIGAIQDSRSGRGKRFKDADSLFEDLGI